MIITRYDIQEVSTNKNLEDQILNAANKFSTKVSFKKTQSITPAGKCLNIRSFDFNSLIKEYTNLTVTSKRQDKRERMDKFLAEMEIVRDNILKVRANETKDL